MPPSKSNPSAIGLMDGAFFVSRGELLAWLNGLLQLDYGKVEQISTGAAMCQVFDAIYPGSVNLRRVNFGAKTEYDSIKNWKVLQTAFTAKKIDKHVDVDRLIKGKYQDNLEFLQWMKRFYDMTAQGDYDAAGKRGEVGVAVPASSAATKAPSANRPTRAAHSTANASKTKENRAPARKASGGATGGAASTGGATRVPIATKSNPSVDPAKIRELNDQIVELKLAKDGLEKERDFYFGKLRDIEVYLQTQGDEDNEIVKQVFAILYATEEDFVASEAVDGEDDVVEAPGITA